MNKISKFVTIL